jgi:hypothetical protein
MKASPYASIPGSERGGQEGLTISATSSVVSPAVARASADLRPHEHQVVQFVPARRATQDLMPI